VSGFEFKLLYHQRERRERQTEREKERGEREGNKFAVMI
jgi:hypothetical protein